MYKFIVVTDPDTASGFRLAGVDVMEIHNSEEINALLPSLLLKDDTGIIAINEDFMMSLDEKMMEKIEKSFRPIIIPIPSRAKRLDRTSYIEGLLRRAIGYNIVLRK
ncbi:MAG TPA: V-type ATP synthase subunit F [Methanoregulaceae archaeon]|nr:MAG: V-type ATP synthase subunit F [Methanolinea sp.]HON80925.1 V-type ATP synthase subunit F [Methanoregulaceae archaeon]HPD09663.1 V-type ATP synthase subunit F [Methanoregulaceae archaeon]HRT15697.1 V-type ATP synthase subunit F [Methanoregulaceae archaeon]HRU31223.1 V-type ATP synthase subunit F [Methanoregulaceae archaeon]